jgi:amidase
MTRTVTDAAIMLGALSGEDPRDPATTSANGKRQKDYTRFLHPNGLRGARVGVVRAYFDIHPAAVDLVEDALETMRQVGATVVDPAELPSRGRFGSAEMEVLFYEFKADLNAYLAALEPGDHPKSLAEIIEFNERHRDREMPYFGQELMVESESKGPLSDQAYKDALAKCRRLACDEGIDAIMDAEHLDALVAPSAGPAATTDLLHGDRDIGGSSSPAAVAGYPSISVPAGFVQGLPVGISFFGRAYSEPVLLKLAFAFEQVTQARRAPLFKASA